jgi:UDP-2,3-diacylglucosamine hydrolase
LLKDLLAPAGVLTRRKPSSEEERDIDFGRRIAAALSELDIGQSVAIAERACVAVEAMEGTDAMLRRAALLAEGKPLRLIKGSRRRKHMLYDVPVIGPQTIAVMRETRATALSIDAGRTLLLDRTELVRQADAVQIAIIAHAERPEISA